jgi:hypothetical protein
MNYFISAYQSASRWKKSIVVVVLLVPLLIGGGNLVKQMPQFADSGHCSSYSLENNSTQSCARTTSTSQTLSFTNNDLKGDSSGLDARKIALLKKWLKSRPTKSTHTVGSKVTHLLGTADLAVKVQKGTAPTGTPPPSIPPAQGSVAAMISQVFGPYASGALNVAKCESGLNPNSYNPTSIGGSHAEGVFQILYPSTWMGTSQASGSPYNAQANILAAHEIFVRDGYSWREWSCAP